MADEGNLMPPSRAKQAVQLPMTGQGLGPFERNLETKAQLDNLMIQVGQQPYRGGQGVVGATIPPPPQATLAVSGSGGVFSATTNAPANLPPGAEMIHEIQSAADANFTSPTSYGQSTQGNVAASHPKQWRYFRLRSKYPNSGFNNWVTYGPIYSGS